MFWHLLKYEIMITLRNKDFLIWLVMFPVILGAFFKVAFSDIYNKDIAFQTVPVAVVQTVENEMFDTVMENISAGDEPLFSITKCSEEEALSLLRNEDVSGIIYADDLSLTVSGEGINQTIIKSFLEQYKVQEGVIMGSYTFDKADVSAVTSVLSEEIQCNTNIPLTDKKIDPYASYFYNLIAMVALFGSMTGLHITIVNQANLSHIGARHNCSPISKLRSTFASLLGSFTSQTVCIAITVTYLAFILRVDFSDRLGFIYLASILGGWVGVSMGFFIGSISKFSEGLKTGIAMSISMIFCYLSGLMVGDIKGSLALNAPWINKINPAAVISDSLYCLVVYDDLSVFIEKIVTLIMMIVVFTLLGFLLSRRKKYASL